MKIYSPYSSRERYQLFPLEKLKKMEKNVGNVYAISTNRGVAVAQVADIEKYNGVYICRIFSKIHADLPENIESYIQKKEDYIIQTMLPAMAHSRVKKAKILGNFNIPDSYKTPDYTKSCIAFGGDNTRAPMKYWHIVPDYLPLGELVRKDLWVKEFLGKDLYDESWREDFKALNPSEIIDAETLIERLENSWSLEKWIPSNFHSNLKDIWLEEY